jgi:cytoskeletal protein CcmA (bactofilin family)
MPPVNAALKLEPSVASEPETRTRVLTTEALTRTSPARAGVETPKVRSIEPAARANQTRVRSLPFQPRVPAIIGEATFRGSVRVDGVITGQMGAGGPPVAIRQRPRTGASDSEPELVGEICFREMLRVNGFVAGKISSEKGTLIVGGEARIDADIQAAVVSIGGTVNGNVTGYERVELGPTAIITGNISTGSLEIKPGAVFYGDCDMLTSKGENS